MSSTTYKTLIMQENYDSSNTPFTPIITQIDKVTGCLTVITEQIIDELEGLEILSPTNLVQVFNESDLIGSNNKYFVLYEMGQIKFSSNLDGVEILIKFGGKGSLFLDACRVATIIDSNGNVVETLHDVISDARSALELIKTANDLVALDTTIKSDIANAQSVCTSLENDTVVAEGKKAELNTIISNAIAKKTELDASTTIANNKKTELDTTVTNGNTLKATLESDFTTGGTLKTNLETNIATGNALKTNLDNSNTIASETLVDLNEAITNGGISTINTNISNLDTNKQNKTDNTLTTVDKTTTGAINEVNTNKQPITDNTLNTTSKTVVGGINELLSIVSGNRSLMSSGYQKLDNGLIVQWGSCRSGTDTGGVYGTTPITIASAITTFPIPFPNACFMVFPSARGNTEVRVESYAWVKTRTSDKNGAEFRLTSPFTSSWEYVEYFAIGY